MLPFLIPLIASVVGNQLKSSQETPPTPFVGPGGDAMQRRIAQAQEQPPNILQKGLDSLSQLNLSPEQTKDIAEPLLKAKYKANGYDFNPGQGPGTGVA